MSRNTFLTITDVLLFMVLAVFWFTVSAEPTHKASGAGVEVVIYSEACALKQFVENLPKRATWTENGKTIEGCGGVTGGLAVFYWMDRTVTVAPANVFMRVIGA